MLTGAVLAGGQSRRYGKNKALETYDGKRLVDRNVEILRGFCSPVLVVAGNLEPFLGVAATLVADLKPGEGPLQAIYTALLFSPTDSIFIRAVDMPFFVPEMAQLMLAAQKNHHVVVPIFNGRPEPLTAIYHRRCLTAIADALEQGERRATAFYKSVDVREIPESRLRVVDPLGLSFKNINTPEDRIDAQPE